MRNDEAVWDALFEKVAEIASKHEMHPAKPRTVCKQHHRANVDAELKPFTILETIPILTLLGPSYN